jgi:CRP-like cAMP-binding protein
MRIAEGPWQEPEWPSEIQRGPGLLVLEGLLLRHVDLQGRVAAELLGAGDVLRPWQREDAVASMARRSGWRVLAQCRIATLDIGFAARTAAYPEIHAEIVARALRRSRQLAITMAIVHQPKVQLRMHMLLWHLADRFGRVRPGGAALELPLTHAQLAELIAARRPTVSAALTALEREGVLGREGETWILTGPPPGELLAMYPTGAS